MATWITSGPGTPGSGTDHRAQGGTLLEDRPKTRKPPLYKVLLHNDDYTTREFVVHVLEQVFRHSESEATQIMLHVHNHGIGVAGIYPHEIAETKATTTMALAAQFEYPLQATLEPDE